MKIPDGKIDNQIPDASVSSFRAAAARASVQLRFVEKAEDGCYPTADLPRRLVFYGATLTKDDHPALNGSIERRRPAAAVLRSTSIPRGKTPAGYTGSAFPEAN